MGDFDFILNIRLRIEPFHHFAHHLALRILGVLGVLAVKSQLDPKF